MWDDNKAQEENFAAMLKQMQDVLGEQVKSIQLTHRLIRFSCLCGCR